MNFLASSLFFILTTFSCLSHGQAINERWIGNWKSGQFKMSVTNSSFEKCKWVGSKPKGAFKGCVAYYAGSVTKKELLSSAQSDVSSVNRMLKERQITNKDYQAFKTEMQTYASIIDQLPNESFKKIFLDEGEMGNPDGGGYYFLNENYIYYVSYSEGGGAGPSFSITSYSKM